jgi:small nuclear ribonucleoprotein (snRNP)-like protein
MSINLSRYVGKTIAVELHGGSVLAGPLTKKDYPDSGYPYEISNRVFTEGGLGMTQPRIIKVLIPSMDGGIAQKAPNINLDNFVGQRVYVKLDRGSEHIANVNSTYNLSEVGRYNKNGTSASGNGYWNIDEIYGERAYEINTKSTFDNPNDDDDSQIKQAKQLLSQMSEEQIRNSINKMVTKELGSDIKNASAGIASFVSRKKSR